MVVVSLIGSGIHTTLCTSILDGDSQQESRVPPDLPHWLGLQRHPASRTAQLLGSGLSTVHTDLSSMALPPLVYSTHPICQLCWMVLMSS